MTERKWTVALVDTDCSNVNKDITCSGYFGSGVINGNDEIAYVVSGDKNANLIAAAPDMYEALAQVLIDIPDVVRRECIGYIEDALTKARVETQ